VAHATIGAVPDFLPFRGIRYRADDLDALTAPPYDVIDPEERAALALRSPRNAVRLILPEGDDRYRAARRDLDGWQEDGTLAVDPIARFYTYRMEFTDDSGAPRHSSGVIGALVLPPAAGEGDVLPHERTLPKAKSDRLALLRETRANLDPIWGLTPSPLTAHLAASTALAVTVDDQGVRHSLGALDDPGAIAAVRAAIAAAPLVLADGHHRFETAITYRDERRQSGASIEADGAVMCLVVELTDDELWVQPIHRLLHGDTGNLRQALAGSFEVLDAGPNTPESVDALQRAVRAEGGVGLADGHGVARLVPKPDALAGARAGLPEPLRDVASAWLEPLTEAALAGVDVTYRNDARTVAALVDKRAVDAALLLPPVTVDQIRAAALAGIRMPQKTTFFAPKPRTGLVVRSLDR
jgi:uncharacterized protein (DUF1015 family)